MPDTQAERCKQLWTSVLGRATADALAKHQGRDNRAARVWFKRGGRYFRMACDMAGFDADAVHDWALKHVPDSEPTLDERIQEMVEQGLTTPQICERVCLSPTAVRNRCRKLGLTPRRSFEPLTEDDVADILKLRREGWTAKQIGAVVGRGVTTVTKTLRRLREQGIDTTKRKKKCAPAGPGRERCEDGL